MTNNNLSYFNWSKFILLFTSLSLNIVGAILVYSINLSGPNLKSEVLKYIIILIVGLVLFYIFSKIDYRGLKNFNWLFYLLSFVMLLMVIIFGTKINGASRWIDLKLFQLQPSEIVKALVILILSAFLSNNYLRTNKLLYIILAIFLVLPFILIIFTTQRDLGTSLVISVVLLTIILLTKFSKVKLLSIAIPFLVITPFILEHILKPYQLSRIEAFLNPGADPLGSGYNVAQSIITIGSGGWSGRGILGGSQSELNYLPQLAKQTDFIFAVLGEKLGFIGAALIIFVSMILILEIIKIGRRSRDIFGASICYSTAAMLLFHLLVNIGMNVGVMPVTGIPLPFVSAGGTNALVNMALLGIIASISMRPKNSLKEDLY